MNDARPTTYLVRVAREMVDELLEYASRPVMLVRIVQQEDGTYDMHFEAA